MVIYNVYSNLLRVTQSATLDTTTGASTQTIHLGKKGKDFEFKDMKIKVEFCSCSAKTDQEELEDMDISALEDWLTKVA